MAVKSRLPTKGKVAKKIVSSTTVSKPGKAVKTKRHIVKSEPSLKKTSPKKLGKSVNKVSNVKSKNRKAIRVKEEKPPTVGKKIKKEENSQDVKIVKNEPKVGKKSSELVSESKLAVKDEQLRKSVKKVRVNRRINRSKSRFNRDVKGCVYFSNIPHGFYEEELKGYLSQFGAVTGVYIPRNRTTGKVRGIAFVEFRFPEVAEVVADTMNNYLMFDKLVKAEIVPPEKQRPKMFHTKYQTNLSNPQKESMVRRKIAIMDETKFKQKIKKSLKRNQKKLKDLGLNFQIQTDRVLPPEDNQTTIKKEDVKPLSKSKGASKTKK